MTKRFQTDRNKELIRRWIAFANGGFAGSFDPFMVVDFTGLVVYRVAGHRIAESWGEIDFLRLIRELRKP
jgi:hypothetical protein